MVVRHVTIPVLIRHALVLRVVTIHLTKIADVAPAVINILAQPVRAMVVRPVTQAQVLQHVAVPMAGMKAQYQAVRHVLL